MEFVTFEIAKKLKEKGFDEECLAYYTSEYTLYLNNVVLCDDKYLDMAEIDYEECLRSYNTQKDRYLRTLVDAPTISQVLKWFREDKKIHLVVDIEPNGYFFIVNYNITIDFDGKYQFDIYNSLSCYYDDKQAVIAGIEYVINKLI